MAELMRTSNPTLNDKAFQTEGVAFGQEAMTISGTVNKTGILLLLALATSAWTWNMFLHSRTPEAVMPMVLVGGIGGFIVAMVTIFKKEWSPVTAPLYALLEGLVLGSVSALFELRWPGLPIQAVSLTFGVLIVLLLAYRSGHHSGDRQVSLRSDRRDRRNCAVLLRAIHSRLLWHSLYDGQWFEPDWDWILGNRRNCRLVEPRPRFRLHRARRPCRSAKVHGMVRRVRPDGYADLAVL